MIRSLNIRLLLCLVKCVADSSIRIASHLSLWLFFWHSPAHPWQAVYPRTCWSRLPSASLGSPLVTHSAQLPSGSPAVFGDKVFGWDECSSLLVCPQWICENVTPTMYTHEAGQQHRQKMWQTKAVITKQCPSWQACLELSYVGKNNLALKTK